jgi:hypothetical protein
MPQLLPWLNGQRRLWQEVAAAARTPRPPGAPLRAQDQALAVPVGSTQVRLVVRRFGTGGLRYLSLHENEQTAVQAAQSLLAQQAGTLVELRAQGRRLLSCRDGLRPLAFDPNRIFSDAGAAATLRQYGSCTAAGMRAAQSLRQAVLAQLAGRPEEPVVALHNNAGARYTIDAYRPGGAHAGDVAALSVAAARPHNAFFLVTRAWLFEALRAARFNVVLQSGQPRDDGSLSVWFQQQRRAYVNVEAGFGALQEQEAMLAAVAALVPRAR